MKVPNFQPFTRKDVPEVPRWLEKYVQPLVDQIQSITQAVKGNLTMGDNLKCEVREFDLGDGEEINVSLQSLKGIPIGASIILNDLHPSALAVKVKDQKTMTVKVDMTDNPASKIPVKVVFWGK